MGDGGDDCFVRVRVRVSKGLGSFVAWAMWVTVATIASLGLELGLVRG